MTLAEPPLVGPVTAGPQDPLLKRETDPSPVKMSRGAAPDEFRSTGLVIRFQRDAGKKVVALTVDAGRVRDITFLRR